MKRKTTSNLSFQKPHNWLLRVFLFTMVSLFGLTHSVVKADTPVPTSVVASYDASLQKLTLTIHWAWSTVAAQKLVTAAVFADLNGDGIKPSVTDNPATYTSGGNLAANSTAAKNEFLGQLASSTIEGNASSTLPYSDNTDNGIAASAPISFGVNVPRVLFPYGLTSAFPSTTGVFTMTFTNLPIAPKSICVLLYDVHTRLVNNIKQVKDISGGHSPISAGTNHNDDNSVEDGNSVDGTVSCQDLVSLKCAVDTTVASCQSQATINTLYAAWLNTAIGTGCNAGVLTNNSASLGGAPNACGGSRTVTFTFTITCAPRPQVVITCSSTFTVLSDLTPPSITCPAAITVAANSTGGCSYNGSIGNATATDNCSPPTITGPLPAGPYPLGNTTVTWKATDACGLTATCTQVVTVTINVDDNNACTIDGCNPNTGGYHTQVSCNDNNACTTDGCNSLTGCTYTPIVCNDNNSCTTDGCNPSTGCTYTPIVCNDQNACTTDGCNTTSGCTYTTVNCDDQNACTTDGCNPSTGCTYTPIVCNDNNACTTDGCNPSTGCTYTAIICDDQNACTTDGCNPSTGCTYTAVVCNDNNACTTDGCNPSTGCTYSPASPLADPTISGTTVVCTGGQLIYTAIGAVGATNYVWTVPPGATIVSGQGTVTIVIEFASTCNCYSGNVCVVASNQCGTANLVCLPVNVITKVPVLGAISGQTTAVCPGLSLQYCVAPVAIASNYVWTVPANTQITSGQGTNCITLSILPGFTTGNVSVKGENCKGLGGPKIITLRKLALQPGVIAGSTSNLCQKTGVVYTIANVTNATSYLWTAPAGGSIVNGQGTTSITVDYNASFVSGNVTVRGVNACGNGPIRNLAVKAKAATPTVINGLTQVCEFDLGVAYNITSQSGVNYNWTVPSGSTVASGQGNSNVSVNWGVTSGNVTVVPSNGCGVSPSKSLAVTVISCNRVANSSNETSKNIKVYPNPVKSDLMIEFKSESVSDYTITLTDVIGKEVYNNTIQATEGINQQSIKVDNFSKGMYFVNIKGIEINKSTRILVD